MLVRKALLDRKDSVMVVKYQLMDFDGQIECLPMEIKPSNVSL